MMLDRRQSLAPEDLERRSQAAQDALIGSAPFAGAKRILLYTAFRGEVGTERIAAAAVAAGKELVLPRVVKEPRGLVLHAYSGDAATLARGAYGIMEPRAEWAVVSPAEVDLVVVPGVAFSRTGGRLGYGGGYYDRLLPQLRHASLIGLAYACQVVEDLPHDPHDLPVDGLATELGYIAIRGDQ